MSLPPVFMIVILAAASIAAMGKLIESSPVSCTTLEITCKLMDGQMQRLAVSQEFDMSSGCTMSSISHVELLELCLASAPPAVSRAQQHTCSVEADKELTAKFSWTTAQGRAAGVTVTNPCRNIDLCVNVTCPAIDACHVEGQCLAGLCSTPNVADGTICDTGTCSQGACGSTVYVSASVLNAASTCSVDGILAVENPEDWLATAIVERKDKLNRLRRQLSAPRRQLSTEIGANTEASSSCDPRHGACPGYDKMYCSQPFALNYRETAVYSTNCCSDTSSMSIFFTTTTQQNKVMVKFHRLNNGEFDFQGGGINYADPVCRTEADTNMLTQHDFDTIAPLFDENSLVDVDSKKYDAFGYPFSTKVASVQFVLENVMEAMGCTSMRDRRKLGQTGDGSVVWVACYLFRGYTTYQCDKLMGAPPGTFKSLMGGGSSTGGAGTFEAASMLFGKFDFSEFGTSAYGSLASPLTAASEAADFKSTTAASSTADFGAQGYASITMDFGDFQFLSLGVRIGCDSKELCAAAAKSVNSEVDMLEYEFTNDKKKK